MTLDEQITILEHNAEYERTHGSLQGCLDFRQLAEWLTEFKKLKEQTEPCEDAISRSHFDERVRLAGGMADEELTQDFKDGVLTVLEMLKTEPSVKPAQKVITCKNCKWFGEIGCAISIVDDSDKPKENDFCSFAEKKKQEMTL